MKRTIFLLILFILSCEKIKNDQNSGINIVEFDSYWFNRENDDNAFEFKVEPDIKTLILHSGPDGVVIENIYFSCNKKNECKVFEKSNDELHLHFKIVGEEFILLKEFSLVGYTFPRGSIFKLNKN